MGVLPISMYIFPIEGVGPAILPVAFCKKNIGSTPLIIKG